MKNSSPKVVVVTGASAGVGRATALEFARSGASVALLARNAEALDATALDVNLVGGRALAIPTDMSDSEAVEDAARQVEASLGPIDVWVNNAMVTVFSKATEMTAKEYDRVTQVTYLGTVHGTLAALRRMQARNRGVIIQVGSAMAYRGIPLQSAYCAAKFAIRGFTDSLRVELIHEGSQIHLTMVQLAAFNTLQFEWARHRIPGRPRPLPPIFQPELAAQAVAWSARHRRRELFVGFPAYKVILGNKLAPRLADHYAAKTAVSGQIDDRDPLFDDGDRGDNLFTPLPGDGGIHGRFNHEAKSFSGQLFLTQNRWLAGALFLTAAGAAALATKYSSRFLPGR